MSQNALLATAAVKAPDPSVFRRHRGPVTCVAALPRRNMAVTSAYDGAVGLFDLESGLVELLGYHRHLVNHITVNHSGTKAASSSSDYDIRIWDLEARQLEIVLRGHSDDVECFAFVDDKTGISASRDHRILIWDLDTAAIRRVLDEHEKDVLSVAFADGMIYSSGDDRTLRQWDLASGRMLRKWGPFGHETDTCAIDSLHGRVVLGCDDGVVRIFDIGAAGLLAEIDAHASGIKKVAVSPVTGDVLSAAYDQKIRVWDSRTFRLKTELDPFTSKWERSFNWSPDGMNILAGTFDGTVVVWDSSTGRLMHQIGAHAETPGNACFNEVSGSPSGEVALVSDDGYVRMGRLTPSSAELTEVVEPASGRMLMNAITLDERYGIVVAGAHNHRLHIFGKSETGLRDEVEVFLGEGPVNSVRVAHCPGFESQIFAACYSGVIARINRSGDILAKFRIHPGAVKALRVHPEHAVGVSCSADGALLGWTAQGEVLERFLGHTSIVDDVDFDPAGEHIASVSRDFTLKVYRFSDAKLLHSVFLGRRSPKAVCFWDRNTVIVSDYWGALIRVDLTEDRVTRNTIAANGISSLCRTDAGLVACSYDGGVYLVEPDDLAVLNVYRAMTQRLVS